MNSTRAKVLSHCTYSAAHEYLVLSQCLGEEQLARLNDLVGLERLFSSGGARPNDILWSNERTALHVCLRFLLPAQNSRNLSRHYVTMRICKPSEPWARECVVPAYQCCQTHQYLLIPANFSSFNDQRGLSSLSNI